MIFHVTSYLCIMEQGAYSAPEPCVDEFPRSFPLKCILYDASASAFTVYVYEDNLEVLIVLLLVPVQHVEELFENSRDDKPLEEKLRSRRL